MIKLITNKYNQREDESEEEWLLKIVPLLDLNIDFGTLEQCKSWVDSVEILEIDTETIKNFNDFSGHVYTFQVGNKDIQWVIDSTNEETHETIKYILRTDKLKLLQNAKYDIKWFLKWGINPTNIYDTMLAEVILNTGYKIGEVGVSLDKLGMRYVGKNISKTIRGQINYLGLTPAVIDYAAGDVEHLSQIREKQLVRIKEEELENILWLENQVVRVFAEMEYNGIYLDRDEWKQVNKEYTKELLRFEDVLNKYIANHKVSKYYTISIDMFRGLEVQGFNFNSSQQVLELLHYFGKENSIKQLKALTTVGEKELEKLAYLEPFIGMYIDYKKMQTNVSKYGEKFLQAINPNSGRVHTNFWQILNTGRVSSGEKDNPLCPNMQNIPKYSDKSKFGFTKHRGCFKAKEGFSFVSLDFSSQELVLIAEDSQEPIWLRALANGWDLHSYVAEMVFKHVWIRGEEEGCVYKESKQKCKCAKHQELRDKIKTVNYGLTYGAGAAKVASILRISVAEAEAIIQEYFGTMTRLRLLFDTLAQYGVDMLKIRTFKPFRRIRYFQKPVDDYSFFEIRRQAMNTRFQGTGADMMKLALVMLYKEFKPKYGDDCLFVLQVHDQVILEVRDEFAEEVCDRAKVIMENTSKKILKTISVKVDGDISKIWKH